MNLIVRAATLLLIVTFAASGCQSTGTSSSNAEPSTNTAGTKKITRKAVKQSGQDDKVASPSFFELLSGGQDTQEVRKRLETYQKQQEETRKKARERAAKLAEQRRIKRAKDAKEAAKAAKSNPSASATQPANFFTLLNSGNTEEAKKRREEAQKRQAEARKASRERALRRQAELAKKREEEQKKARKVAEKRRKAQLAANNAAGTSTTSTSTTASADTSNISTSSKIVVAAASKPSSVRVSVRSTRTGEIYLLRGLADVFSRGMDTLAVKLRKRGYNAYSYNHGQWRSLADDIVYRARNKQISYPIVISGHSLGANDAVHMANYLGANGVKVAYVASFDPTISGLRVGKGVGHVVNYYIPTEYGTRIAAGAGFTGKVSNVRIAHTETTNHLNVEKKSKFHSQVISRVGKITRRKRRS